MSTAYRFKRRESPGEGVRRIALGRAGKARAALERAGTGTELADSIHAARKDLKKLRAVLRLVREELGEKRFRAENRRARDAGRLLAGTRDAEVKLETVAALEERFPGELPEDTIRAWTEALEAELAPLEGGAAVAPALRARLQEASGLVEASAVSITAWGIGEEGSWELLAPGLRTTYRAGRRALHRTVESPDEESAHEWRKRSKDLWYQLRLLQSAWPELIEPTAEQAHRLADLLGEHQDLAVLRADLSERPTIERPGALESAIDRRQEELLEQSFEIGRRLYAEKPKAFARRFERYWLAWREEP